MSKDKQYKVADVGFTPKGTSGGPAIMFRIKGSSKWRVFKMDDENYAALMSMMTGQAFRKPWE